MLQQFWSNLSAKEKGAFTVMGVILAGILLFWAGIQVGGAAFALLN